MDSPVIRLILSVSCWSWDILLCHWVLRAPMGKSFGLLLVQVLPCCLSEQRHDLFKPRDLIFFENEFAVVSKLEKA
eukprot:jgi/Picre1/35982/NNA_003439.t1